jgi:hypothetical protein
MHKHVCKHCKMILSALKLATCLTVLAATENWNQVEQILACPWFWLLNKLNTMLMQDATMHA